MSSAEPKYMSSFVMIFPCCKYCCSRVETPSSHSFIFFHLRVLLHSLRVTVYLSKQQNNSLPAMWRIQDPRRKESESTQKKKVQSIDWFWQFDLSGLWFWASFQNIIEIPVSIIILLNTAELIAAKATFLFSATELRRSEQNPLLIALKLSRFLHFN